MDAHFQFVRVFSENLSELLCSPTTSSRVFLKEKNCTADMIPGR